MEDIILPPEIEASSQTHLPNVQTPEINIQNKLAGKYFEILETKLDDINKNYQRQKW